MATTRALLLVFLAAAHAATPPNGDVVVSPPYAIDPALTDLGRPQGFFFNFTLPLSGSSVFNGTDPTFVGTECDGPTPAECCHKAAPVNNRCAVAKERLVSVYVPAAYIDGAAASLLIMGDGPSYLRETAFALDNLVGDASRPLPPFVAISVANGGCDAVGSERGLEYDTMSDRYARFIEKEVLPAVSANVALRAAYPNFAFSADPTKRGIFGCSSGGAAALTAAFFRPDLFRRVAAYSATLVDQQNHADASGAYASFPQGAWGYHSGAQLLRRNASLGLRVFHSASEFDLGYNLTTSPVDDPTPAANNTAGDPNNWSDGHHNWREAGNRTAAALKASGYAYRHVYALGAHHCDGPMLLSTLADTLVWLWAA